MHSKRRQNNMMNGGGGQHRHHNNRPRRFNNGGRPDGNDGANVMRVRRNATQSKEKYQNLARDAMSMGDRVLAENYLQHVDHFHRVLLSLPPEEQRHQHQRQGQQQGGPAEGDAPQHDGAGAADSEPMEINTASGGALPSFITHKPPVDGAVIPPSYEE